MIAARDGRERKAHLENLFRAYWTPVHAYIRLGWAKTDEDARDLTQAFFLRLLETDFLREVDPAKGRFRTYVRACLRNHLLDVRKTEEAAKRGGGKAPFSLDGLAFPPDLPAAGTPEAAFDEEWVRTLLRTAVPELQRALESAGDKIGWEVFRRLDVDDDPAGRPSYAELAKEFGVEPQVVKSRADHARKSLRTILRRLVAEYSISDREAAEELRELFGS